MDGNKPLCERYLFYYMWYFAPGAHGGPSQPMGGGQYISNGGSKTPRDKSPKTTCQQKGDPVVLSTGNEVTSETDFQSSGQMGLSLTRTYNYYWNGIGLFGRRWLSNYDYKLLFTTHDPTSPCYTRPGNTACDPTGHPIWALRPDGRLIKYNYATSPAPGWYEDSPSPIAKILKSGSTYTLYGADHSVETYDANGFPVAIDNQQGQGWTFAYDANHYLTTVTSSSGRQVDFGWSNGLLTSVTDPAGNVYHYTYTTIPVTEAAVRRHTVRPMLVPVPPDPTYPGGGPGLYDPPPAPSNPPDPTMVGLLASTTQPGTTGGAPATTLTYHYENASFPTALTGKSINAQRYSWITYNAQAMVAETHLANNVQDYHFTYTLDANNRITRTEVTNPLGRQTTYHFDANGNRTSVTGAASPNCPSRGSAFAYDANGHLTQATDFDGNVTLYTYAANGELLSKVQGSGAAAAQTTQYTWNTTYNRAESITLVGDHLTTFTYDAENRLASVTVKNLSSAVAASQNQTRTTTFTYTTWPNGLIKTQVIDGPLAGSGDATTLTFSQTGDLSSQYDGLGHATTYGNYNALGEPGYIIGPNGARRDFSYDARGRVVDVETHRNGTAQHTAYQYDAYGKLEQVTPPDGHALSYQYDLAGRLTAQFQAAGDGTYDETAYTYNADSLPTKVTHQRVFAEPARGTQP